MSTRFPTLDMVDVLSDEIDGFLGALKERIVEHNTDEADFDDLFVFCVATKMIAVTLNVSPADALRGFARFIIGQERERELEREEGY